MSPVDTGQSGNGAGGFMQSTSVWMATAALPNYPALTRDARADVCVVGAGIAGMTTAYLLARQGRSVIVLDGGPVGAGVTARTTAHLSNVIDDGYDEIERLHGHDGARLTAESHSAAIDWIEAIVAHERIDCEFVRLDGYLFAPPGESTEVLACELKAARRAGLQGVEMIPGAPLPRYSTGPCLRFARQGQFHPVKYLSGLSDALLRAGGRIHSGTHVDSVEGGSPARAVTAAGPVVRASAVVVTTNSPINDRLVVHNKIAAYLSYVIGARVPRGAVPRALYWDTADPYHYVRLESETPERGDDVLIVGGEDHKTGQAGDADARYARLESWARERVPTLGAVEARWSGQFLQSIDGLAFIGRDPAGAPNVYIATGDSGMGMTHGTIAGILLSDLIHGRENPWAGLYDPARKTVGAAGVFVRENLNLASQYLDWMSAGEVSSVNEIGPGQGAVIRRGLVKVAVYRDEQGRLHEYLAVCWHLGCLVRWNGSERTWDCPCHGSRYDRYGQVISGPSTGDLVPWDGADAS
jgi:glycine/D-amino acid oxidase-like deaminating enzyme/nitrite reductase/ring-hydroxylating ferredoxin subunit